MQPTVGEIFEGKVTGITKFGAFVELPGGGNGLVHISEIANTYVNDVHDYISEGQVVKLKVVGTTEDGKVNLSIKKALPQPPSQNHDRNVRKQISDERRPKPQSKQPEHRCTRSAPAPKGKTDNDDFEDKLKHFMKDSDSRIADSRLYSDKKSSYRRRRD